MYVYMYVYIYIYIYIIYLLAPCSGSLPWNPLAVAISACLRNKHNKRVGRLRSRPAGDAAEPRRKAPRVEVFAEYWV